MSVPRVVSDVPTPCLLVDLDIVKKNAQAMLDTCKSMGLTLRHMTKTHKTSEIAAIATGGTKRGISTSTLAEAEFYADHGFDDILCTCLVAPHRLQRLCVLATRVQTFHVMVDSMRALELLETAQIGEGDKPWSVFLNVDVGGSREGVLWDDTDGMDIARRINKHPRLRFQGLYAHDGNSYDVHTPDEIREVGQESAERLMELAGKLRAEGISVPDVGVGSTPTASRPAEAMKQLTEMHPGNYIFYDSMQACHGSCNVTDIAVRVATRVVGHYPHRNQLLVDAGFTALSSENKDRKGIPNGSICLVQDTPMLRLVGMSQEYGVMEPRRGQIQFEDYPIGKLLFLWPYHSCATAACFREYYIHEGEDIKHVWKPCAGW